MSSTQVLGSAPPEEAETRLRARHAPLFGLFASPALAELDSLWAVVEVAARAGIDLLTIQDHPYHPAFLDTWTLLVAVAARTERLRVMPNVTSLPLRPPAMLAKAAATLQHVSGGRLVLGLGAGASWDGIAALGGRRLTPAQAVDALDEAITVIRLLAGEADDRPSRAVSFEGRWYRLANALPGPPIDAPLPLWLGAMGPRMLRLTGARADGWSVNRPYVGPDRLIAMQRTIDEAAIGAGRDPRAIRRAYNLVGTIDERAGEARTVGGVVVGPTQAWAGVLADAYARLGMDTFIFAPAAGGAVEQMRRFAEEVVPRARQAIAGATRS